jgi:uncharacterized protein
MIFEEVDHVEPTFGPGSKLGLEARDRSSGSKLGLEVCVGSFGVGIRLAVRAGRFGLDGSARPVRAGRFDPSRSRFGTVLDRRQRVQNVSAALPIPPDPCHTLGNVSRKRVLVVADMVHPFIYRDAFPSGLESFDVVLCAGDLPGSYIEFIATRVACPVVWVHGNHGEEKVKDYLGNYAAPGGAIAAHGRLVRVAGLSIVGWGGAPKYRENGEGMYTGLEARIGLTRLGPQVWWNELRTGRPLDIFLTHAAPPGPHAGKDFAHRPCRELGEFMRRHRPTLLVHGHMHAYDGKQLEYTDEVSGTRVINGFGYTVLEFEVGSATRAA